MEFSRQTRTLLIGAVACLPWLSQPPTASAAKGGPDSSGYCFVDSLEPNGPSVGFQDISGTGTPLSLADDQVSAPIVLGFDFSLYGVSYRAVRVSSNGFLTLGQTFETAGSTGCCGGHQIPSELSPNKIVAGYWTDLDPAAGGSIEHVTSGTPGNRVFTVQFTGVPHQCGVPSPCPGDFFAFCDPPPDPCFPATFQIGLFESSNQIVVRYGDNSPDTRRVHAAGIEDAAGQIGLQYEYGNDVAFPAAVEYLPPGDGDEDGLSNCDEVVTYGSDPANRDTDGDGFGDGFEVNGGSCAGIDFHGGSDPTNPLSVPVAPADVPGLDPGPLPQALPLLCG